MTGRGHRPGGWLARVKKRKRPQPTPEGAAGRSSSKGVDCKVVREPPALDHGRLESRAIRTTDRLNGHLTFPHVAQAFLIERTATGKKSGKTSVELAFGVASHSPDTADPRRLLELNRGHWKVESVHDILDNASTRTGCASAPDTAPSTPPG